MITIFFATDCLVKQFKNFPRVELEPGEFIVMVGSSSADEDLLKASFWVK